MNRTIIYHITADDNGRRIEHFLKRRGFSSQNITVIKRMPLSILVNGDHRYMRDTLTEGDCLTVHIQETKCSEKIPPVKIPLHIVYEDEDLVVVN